MCIWQHAVVCDMIYCFFFCWFIFDCSLTSILWVLAMRCLYMKMSSCETLFFFLFEHVIWVKIVLKLMHIQSPANLERCIICSVDFWFFCWFYSCLIVLCVFFFLHVVFNASVTCTMREIQLKAQFFHVRYVTYLERSMLESLDSLFDGPDSIRFVMFDMPVCGGMSCSHSLLPLTYRIPQDMFSELF